jgi:hypothetical protein
MSSLSALAEASLQLSEPALFTVKVNNQLYPIRSPSVIISQTIKSPIVSSPFNPVLFGSSTPVIYVPPSSIHEPVIADLFIGYNKDKGILEICGRDLHCIS